MWPHFVNLLGRSWDLLLSGLSSTTLSLVIFSFTVPILTLLISFGLNVARRRRTADPIKKAALKDSVLPTLLSIIAVIFVVGGLFAFYVVKTVFNDHQTLVDVSKKLSADNQSLKSELEWRRDNLSTMDPVFPNIIYMLQAFNAFRRDMNGAPCVLYASAPKETVPLAGEIMQLGGPLSGCSPFGPVSADESELDPEVIDGMVPDVIVVHALEGERAADNLFSTLGNQIQLKRSYRLLRHPEKRWAPRRAGEHLVWLQFGKNVKWNSQLRQGK